MKKQNKTKWLDRHYILIIFLFGIIVVGSAIYLKYTPKYWCQVNPDKCVCEEYKVFTTAYGYKSIFVKSENEAKSLQKESLYNPPLIDYECSQFRKKIQLEIDTEDCINNPREDNQCKCEEEINATMVIYDNGVVLTYSDNFFQEPVVGGSKLINKTRIKKCITARLKTECEKGNLDWTEEIKTSCGNFKRDQWELNTSQCRYIETICIKKGDI